MFGHDWEQAQGTVVDSRITGYTPVGPGYNEVPRHEFVVDVRRQDGTTFRTTIEEPRNGKMVAPDPGTVVRVQIDRKGRVRFDESDPAVSTDAVLQQLSDRGTDAFRDELAQPPGTPAPGVAAQAPVPGVDVGGEAV